MTPPLSTPSPTALGQGDRHLPGLLVLGGGGGWMTPPLSAPSPAPLGLHDRCVPGLLASYSSPLNWQESLSLSSLCVTGQP